MLDSIRILTELPESSDAHLSREDMAAARQRRSLQQQARRWARDCVEQARRDAEAIHAQAFREGYAEGLLRATGHLANGLLESQSLGAQLRKDLAQAARDLLAQALSRPEWLDDMLERWLTGHQGGSGAVLQVLLPAHFRSRGNELREQLRRLWPGELVIDYHPQERYVVRLADQLLEFDVETTRQRLEPRLLACIANLPESVRSLDQRSMQALTELCSTFAERPARCAHTAPTEALHEN
ncbi:oxygen-regulated invasion protein OrgB [Pseudomonas izuensis]|uniref:Oxygen-regulated invasion protein OrgB n=1 Tax=Pseudomonas izuensis TaxID=2684212 RepID=A0ABM7RXS6_9PSED|nr:oxygen-regulated invasion protein OrgB [Pseudomonas izuensis]BCX66982.1 oxygen-regulated invasion protein OrgB [Pseudomonas izuensis]